jgi:hypothetical protein
VHVGSLRRHPIVSPGLSPLNPLILKLYRNGQYYKIAVISIYLEESVFAVVSAVFVR